MIYFLSQTWTRYYTITQQANCKPQVQLVRDSAALKAPLVLGGKPIDLSGSACEGLTRSINASLNKCSHLATVLLFRDEADESPFLSYLRLISRASVIEKINSRPVNMTGSERIASS